MQLERIIPGLTWIRNYQRTWLTDDLSAGLTVGVMLIPQGMAYAMIAGLPPIYGLYASTIPLVIYALFGSSRQLAVGPVAMVSLLTATGISAMAEAGSEVYISLAILLALMVGVIQFTLGTFRMGFVVNFLSHPVISGFTSAAALIIGVSQLKHLLGIDLPRSHHIHEVLWSAVESIGGVNLPAVLIGVVSIGLIILLKRNWPMVPGQLVVVVLGILIVWMLGLTPDNIKIVGDIPRGLPEVSMPIVSTSLLRDLLPTALAISLVSFMESIAVAKAVQARRRDYQVNPDQELRALGLANIFGSFFQSFTTTGGFSRTAVNEQAGARTGLASIVSAVLIILTLLFLTPLFYFLPLTILAAVIMVAVFGLIDFKEAIHLWHANRLDFWMLLSTFVATLALGIEQGVGFGVILSLLMVIFRTSRPHIASLGRIPNTAIFRNLERFDDLEVRQDLLIVRLDAQLYFANTNFFRETIDTLVDQKGEKLTHILISAESISYVDSSAMHMLEEMIETYSKRGLTIWFSGVKGPVRDQMAKDGLLEKIGLQNMFLRKQDAYDQLCQNSNGLAVKERNLYTAQTNLD